MSPRNSRGHRSSRPSRKRGDHEAERGRRKALVPVTGRRLWLFRGLSVFLIPVSLILMLEVGLRLGGYGFPAGATIPCDLDGVACRGDNVKFGRRFFPRNIAQEFDPFIFPAVKPKGVCRIFVLGASAAQGTPDPAYSFGRIMEVMLDHACPQVDFQVTVAAMPAINSHVVVEVARDLARYEPDFFVVYLGNNEVVGPYGPGTVFAPLSSSRALIRAGLRLKATATGQLLAAAASKLGADRGTPKVWQGLEMFQGRHVAADDPRLPTVYRHFRRNLEHVRRIAVESGAEIVFCTVGSNLRDCPPFASMHRSDLSEQETAEWDELYKRGVQYEAGDDYTSAVDCYLAAARIDGGYADLQFRLARCYRQVTRYEEARERFALARDLDALRLRPDRHINAVIREVAASGRERVHLVDTEQVFQAASPYGLPGRELFHEHVHMTFHGNYVLAGAVCEKVLRATGMAGESPFPDEATCAERLAYNAWARYNALFKIRHYYLARPPFMGQLDHDRQMARLEQELTEAEAALTTEACEQISAEYRRLIEQTPADIWLRLRFAEFSSVRLGDEPAAVEQCRRVQERVPHSYKPHLLLALSLGRLNRYDEAIEHLRRAVALKPTCEQAYHLLGLACQARGRLDEAMRCYAEAVRLRPDNAEACRRMHDILLGQGKTAEAQRVLRQAPPSGGTQE